MGRGADKSKRHGMPDQGHNQKQPNQEIQDLRQRIAELEKSETRLKRLTEAWRDLWAQYEAIIEAFDGYLYICSPNYEVEFMNQRFIERTGYYPLGQKCYKAIHDREDICPWCVNERVFRGETVRWETLSPKDHRWYYVVNTPIRHPDGSVSKMAMIQDITERKEMEKALKEAEEKYRGIFENAVEGIFQTTPEGRYLSVNPALARMRGFETPEELMAHVTDIGRELYVDPADRDRFKQLLETNGVVKGFKTRMHRLDGSIMWVLINARSVRDEDGAVKYFEGFVQEIRESDLP
jgi:PAS domain S-box-containing protein